MRIFYSICGEGLGHAVRSKPILDHLKKKHHITIFSSGKAKNYLARHFTEVEEIPGLFMYYRNNTVNEIKTILISTIKFPLLFFTTIRLWKLLKKEQPDAVIIDYEPLLSYAAYLAKIPVISIDNQHIVDVAELDVPRKGIGFLETKIVNKILMIHARKYFAVSFFFPKKLEKYAWLGYPVIRKELKKFPTRPGSFVLVYQTSQSNHALLKALKEIPEHFIIYGFDTSSQTNNITLKKFNEQTFFHDLAHCKAVITNGGFSLISEALFLGKPILSFPVRRQYEQWVNAHYLQCRGFGAYYHEVKKEYILQFLKQRKTYLQNIKKIRGYNDQSLLIQLDQDLKDLSPKKTLGLNLFS